MADESETSAPSNDVAEQTDINSKDKTAGTQLTDADLDATLPASAPLAAQEISTSSDSSAEMDRVIDSRPDQTDGYKHGGKYHERSSETESLLSDVLESAERIYSKHVHGKP